MFRWQIVLCCVFTIIGSIQCGEYLKVENRNYYISYPQKLSWYLAYRFCAFHDMYLIDVGDEAENTRIVTLVNHVNTKFNNKNTEWWTSGTDLASEGKYYWSVNGQDFTYTNWIPGQPDNTRSGEETENCVRFSSGNSNKWTDHLCSKEAYFMCRETLNQSSNTPTKCSNSVPK